MELNVNNKLRGKNKSKSDKNLLTFRQVAKAL